MLLSVYFGFEILSTKMPRVFSSMASANACGSVEDTNLTLIPKVGKVTVWRGLSAVLGLLQEDRHAFELVEALRKRAVRWQVTPLDSRFNYPAIKMRASMIDN
jgi:hypothetical protein